MGRYSLSNAIAAIRNPDLVRGEVREIGERINKRYYAHFQGSQGESVMEKDWDTLVILDACRPDVLRDIDVFDFPIETYQSHGSNSREFIEQNFVGETFHDTVYVSANPYLGIIPEDTFHDVISLLDDEWDDSLGTVPPEAVVDHAREAHNEYPNKRIVVHFMQPHAPFVGQFGQQVSMRSDFRNVVRNGGDNDDRTVYWYLQYQESDVDLEDVRRAYHENARIATRHAQRLIDSIDGRVAVTADHGELLGDRQRPVPVRGYGHEPGLHVPELVTVPWITIEAGTRRDIETDPPQDGATVGDTTVKDRLSALGYR